MNTALIIGVIAILVMALPAAIWLTKLIRPPKPEAEDIDRKVAAARKDMRQKIGRLPPV
jgi:nucleoside permease NupC